MLGCWIYLQFLSTERITNSPRIVVCVRNWIQTSFSKCLLFWLKISSLYFTDIFWKDFSLSSWFLATPSPRADKSDDSDYLKLARKGGGHNGTLYERFKPQDPHTNSPDWSPHISLKNELREFDKRSKHFPFGDLYISSHKLFSWCCTDIVRRKFMLIWF